MSFPKGDAYVASNFVAVGHESSPKASMLDTSFESVPRFENVGREGGIDGTGRSNFVSGGREDAALDIQVAVTLVACSNSEIAFAR